MKKLEEYFNDEYSSKPNYAKIAQGLRKTVKKPAELSPEEIAKAKKLKILGIKTRVESEFLYNGYPLDSDKKTFRYMLSRVYKSLYEKGFWNRMLKNESLEYLIEIYKDKMYFPETLENPQPKLKIGQAFSINKYGDGLGRIRKITFAKKADVFGDLRAEVSYCYEWSGGRKNNRIDICNHNSLESALFEDKVITIESCKQKEAKYFARHPRTSIFYI